MHFLSEYKRWFNTIYPKYKQSNASGSLTERKWWRNKEQTTEIVRRRDNQIEIDVRIVTENKYLFFSYRAE